jgi:3-oxo-5-alpha-steroid 4-dehydrogenase 1
MIDQALFRVLLVIWSGLAAGAFILLFFVSAPYGKISRAGWGPKVDDAAAWVAMEAVSLAGISFFFLTGNNRGVPYLVFFLLWLAHYIYRALIFPFLRRGRTSRMPLAVMLSGMSFNGGNTFFNGWGLFHGDRQLGPDWVVDPRFIVGAALFLGGFILNVHSDHILRNLRRGEDRSYKIPRRGFFRFVSCPNYLGEILEWIGWAVLTWSWAGGTFALWTIANLAPRAASYHAWYKKTFPEYPRQRKALIPFIL